MRAVYEVSLMAFLELFTLKAKRKQQQERILYYELNTYKGVCEVFPEIKD